MTITQARSFRIALAAIVGIGCLFVSEKVSLTSPGSLVTEAYAIIGRPLTPMSYAGVARRTTARAVVAAPVYAAPVVVTPRCVQSVDAYGRIYTRCY
jgi:hypothetical protein